MNKVSYSVISLLFIILNPAYSQIQAFQGDTANYCIYTEGKFSSIPYLLTNDERIEKIVDDICTTIGYSRDFQVLAASIPSVATVRDTQNYFLLYSKYFTRQLLDNNPDALHAILAHEIGHIVREHKLDGRFRASEESSAHEFMGRALYHLNETKNFDALMNTVQSQPFAYKYLIPDSILQVIVFSGWKSIDHLILSDGNLGYFENEVNPEDLPLPVFEVMGCPKFHDFDTTFFSNCENLGQVDNIISDALNKMRYNQKRYYAVPNGFAVVTPVEQIDANGISFQGDARWTDYPVINNFKAILKYLKSIFIPQPGNFRLFAFVVTAQPTISQPGKVDKTKIQQWLTNGGFWLPDAIAKEEFAADYHVGVFVYEFEVINGLNYFREPCISDISGEEHLKRSGIFKWIRR